MLKKVLELQLSMVHAIQEVIKAVMQCSERTLPLSGPIMVKTPRECETKRLIIVSEGRECGQRSNPTIKTQSTSSSSVIDVTNYADRGCGPRSILGKTVNAVPVTYGSNASIKVGNDNPLAIESCARTSKQLECCQLQQNWMTATLAHVTVQEYSWPRPPQERQRRMPPTAWMARAFLNHQDI